MVLPNPPMFVGWGIRAELILYTSHFFKQALILGKPQWSLIGTGNRINSSLDVGLTGSVYTCGQFHLLFIKLTGGLVLVCKYK